MKRRTIIIGFLSVVFAATNAKAAVGETIAQLIARYGEPEGGSLALMLGIGEWKTKQGGKVTAMLEDGKAVVISYSPDDSGGGGVDGGTKNTLLERSLPDGQKWVNGKAPKHFVLSHGADPKEIDQVQFWETKDGKLWAMYNPEKKELWVATSQGFKKIVSLAESKEKGGF